MNKSTWIKLFFIAIITFIVAFLFNEIVLTSIGYSMIIGGSDFENSYHGVTYSGIAGLASLVVVCTYIIVGKINELLEEIRKNK